LGGIQCKIDKLLDAIETVGISNSLAERIRQLESDKRDAETRLQAVKANTGPCLIWYRS
jgi:hypothetical protein